MPERKKRFEGKRAVQVVLTKNEFNAAKIRADRRGVSVPEVARHALNTQEWLENLMQLSLQLEQESQRTLVLAYKSQDGSLEEMMSLKLIPNF